MRKQDQIDLIPSKIKEGYNNFKLVQSTSYYLIFEALNLNSDELHTIRVLDLESSLVSTNYNLAASFFVKELLRLCSVDSESLVISDFEIDERRMGAVTQLSTTIKPTPLLKQSIGTKNYFEFQLDFKSLIKDMISNMEFLTRELKLANINSILQPDNMFMMKETGTFFIGDWLKCFTPENNSIQLDDSDKLLDRVASISKFENLNKNYRQDSSTTCDITQELVSLGFTILKLGGVEDKLIETLRECREQDMKLFKDMLEEILQNIRQPDSMKNELRKLFKKDLPIQNPEKKANSNNSFKQNEEVEEKKNELPEKLVAGKEITKTELKSKKPETNIVWSTLGSPHVDWKINIYDLNRKKKHMLASEVDNSWEKIFVNAIPNSNFLISTFFKKVPERSYLEISDLSKKELVNFFSSGIINHEGIGDCEPSINIRRGLIVYFPIRQRISYHLMSMDANRSNFMQIRRTKWLTEHKKNQILGTSLDSEGRRIATIDDYNYCLVSDVDGAKPLISIELEATKSKDPCPRAIWSPVVGSPLLFLKYSRHLFNVYNIEKQAYLLIDPVQLENTAGTTFAFDICPADGNLIACGGVDQNVKIYDIRVRKIIKTLAHNFFSKHISCVRWNESGDQIAVSSFDGDVKLIDYPAGKLLQNISLSSRTRKLENIGNHLTKFFMKHPTQFVFLIGSNMNEACSPRCLAFKDVLK